MMADEILLDALNDTNNFILNSNPNRAEFEYTFSRRFRKKMKRLFAGNKRLALYNLLKTSAAFFFAVILLTEIILLISGNGYAKTLTWFFEMLRNNYYHTYSVSDRALDISSYTLSEILPCDRFEKYETFSSDDGSYIEEIYLDENGLFFDFMATAPQYDGDIYFITDNRHIEYYADDTFSAQLFISNLGDNDNLIIWKNKFDVQFSLSGIMEADELILLAKKINNIFA